MLKTDNAAMLGRGVEVPPSQRVTSTQARGCRTSDRPAPQGVSQTARTATIQGSVVCLTIWLSDKDLSHAVVRELNYEVNATSCW